MLSTRQLFRAEPGFAGDASPAEYACEQVDADFAAMRIGDREREIVPEHVGMFAAFVRTIEAELA